jgi:hypothetical protein
VSLAQAIYERWLQAPRLIALVPGDRVFTGRAAGDVAIPYAVIAGLGAQSSVRTTHTTVDSARFEIAGWVDEHAAARLLLDELRHTYDRQGFAVENDRCLLMQLEEERITPEGDCGWRAVAVYRALHERLTAVPP